jgi:transposase
LVRLRGEEVQRLEKLLKSAALKLSSMISDLNGSSGRPMIEALIAGEPVLTCWPGWVMTA